MISDQKYHYIVEVPIGGGGVAELCRCEELIQALAVMEALWRGGPCSPEWIKVTRVAIL
jgi:hypothetical protein